MGILLLLLAIALIAGGAWLIAVGNVVAGIIIAILGIVVLVVGYDRGYYRRTPL